MLLEISGLHKKFGSNHVLRGVDLSVRNGSVVCLVGSSGSGKSTLLRCINLLETPTSGSIEFDGTPITAKNVKAHQVRRQIGMVFQHFNLFPHMTVLKNVMEGPVSVLGMSNSSARQIATEQLEKVGLREKINEKPTSLSGGQQQRVAIARALAMHPKMMLFDEPTSALDPELVGEVLNAMKNLADDGMTMMVVTHEMSFASRVADWVVLLGDGVIAEQGPPSEVLRNPQSDKGKEFLSHFQWQASH